MVFQVVNNPADFQWHPQVRHVSPMTHHAGLGLLGHRLDALLAL